MEQLVVKKRNVLTLVLFIIYLLALTWLILFKLQFTPPVLEEGRVINFIPFLGSFREDGAILFSEIRVNILAFIPFGIYICMLKTEWSFVKKLLSIVVLTLTYEITQFIFAIGRVDITDVLTNTLGGVIGIYAYVLLFRLLKGRTNQVINIVATAFTILTFSLVTLLLLNDRWIMIR